MWASADIAALKVKAFGPIRDRLGRECVVLPASSRSGLSRRGGLRDGRSG
jgi:hypothetical protein